MDISQLISPERVKCLSGIGSKKRALESISNLLGSGVAGIDPTEIFNRLIERERLGSTGLGHGVAIPHGRLDANTEDPSITLGCFIKLEQAVDFDSPDKENADLLFGLLVPENCTEEHLQVLAALAGMFSDIDFCNQLRDCQTDEALFTLLSGWALTHQAAS